VRGSSKAGDAHSKIARILRVLATNIEEVPSLDDLAEAVGMSRFQLSRTFHKVVGMSIRDYVRDLRLKRACALLTTARHSITNIALQCGFYDSSHFAKAFRRRFGITPSEFRHRNRQQARPGTTGRTGSGPNS
jgi:AraC family transcriptional activator of pyochelin receptor